MAVRLIVVAALCLLPHLATAQTAGLPLVRVVGPLPVSAESYPLGAADHTRVPEDLKKVGYIEEEFLVSGAANVYDWATDGAVRVRTANAPYTTRVLIRRPVNRARFSGTAILEPLNPSNRFPRTPRLNGKVERSHRVDDQESYQLLDQDGISDDIHLFNEKLREWEDYYNYHRPHGALDGQTPYERLVAKTRAEPLPKA